MRDQHSLTQFLLTCKPFFLASYLSPFLVESFRPRSRILALAYLQPLNRKFSRMKGERIYFFFFFFKEFEIWIRRWKWIGLKNIWNRIYFIAFNCSWNILSRFKIISILYIYLWCVSLLFELFSLLNFTILFYIFYK